jgi:hypothetical protein
LGGRETASRASITADRAAALEAFAAPAWATEKGATANRIAIRAAASVRVERGHRCLVIWIHCSNFVAGTAPGSCNSGSNRPAAGNSLLMTVRSAGVAVLQLRAAAEWLT